MEQGKSAAHSIKIEHILWLPIGAMVVAIVLCTQIRLPKEQQPATSKPAADIIFQKNQKLGDSV